MTRPRILIIEDEAPIREGLRDVFVFHGYEVEMADRGDRGLERALAGGHHLIVLDLMLPGLDGLTICNRIRDQDRHLPIIMLTAKGSEEEIIEGLRMGADDYLPKPFSLGELLARVEAVLRRSGRLRRDMKAFQVGSLTIHPDELVGRHSGDQEVTFTQREIEILLYLNRHRLRPVSRQELLQEVWGYANVEFIETRTVDIHMTKLRRKIEEDSTQPRFLITVRGEGYQLRGAE